MSLGRKRIDFNVAFDELKRDIVKMFEFTGTGVSGMGMYQLIYDLCTAYPKPFSERLYCAIADFLCDYATGVRQAILSQDEVVPIYSAYWKKYSIASFFLNSTCNYLNDQIAKTRKMAGASEKRPFVGQSNYPRQDVQALANQIWRDYVVMEIKLRKQNRLMYQIFETIRQDREGHQVNSSVVQEAILSLVSLNSKTNHPLELYIDEFETPYISQTKAYYKAESCIKLSSCTISQYMHSAIDRLAQEGIRNSRYCHPTSHARIIQECETQYISEHQKNIQSEFERMIAHEKTEDCTMAYSLLSRIEEGITPLLNTFERYITTVGRDIILGLGPSVAKDPREYVERLIELHTKYMQMCARVFTNDAAFVAAVDKAFRTIVNDTATNTAARSPEVMARYTDTMLRKKQKTGLSESEIEDRLTRVVILFKYIDDKDLFQKFYSRVLAKRLIFDASMSAEAEANMISRLKNACGVEYTSKLQRMFTDMTISSDLNSGFKEWLQNNDLSNRVDFSILVLTAGSWPVNSTQPLEFQYPDELGKSITNFTTFYDNRHSGRKLSWFWHWCRADVRVNYLDKRYELSLSLYQFAVLAVFNAGNSYTVSEIRDQTKLVEFELIRVVKSLVEANLLTLEDPEANVSLSTVLNLNMKFSNKRTKLKISGGLQADTPQETTATLKAVDEDRRLCIQASIVRIMKSRRVLSHMQLVQEVIEQCKTRFSPSVPMIKKCIEQLLDKQYIERAENSVDRYVYVT
ncbi:Cullin-2 [Mortierella sp. AD011]|nr:Cullin-2 [Mortierella sp. AD010]KAF9400171.1 Cullin-2 [Mortierella sp. AD011]